MEARPGTVILIGGGGHCLVVAEAAHRLGVTVAGVLDDRKDAPAVTKMGLPLLGGLHDAPPVTSSETSYFVCVGDTALRAKLVDNLQRLGCRAFGPIVSPDATISKHALLDSGVFVGPRAVVNCFARIGAHAIINTGAIIEHDCLVGASSHVAPGCVVAGAAQLGDRAFLGIGARVLPRKRIGAGATVGAGAVVTRDVEAGATVVGVPARALVAKN
ncbi:MAG: NeuD/PglB/VioB family sugar acetyltransferase [Planctomycetes bacterium]|nr:NeuD/PglB/VioB family sugar acetyltransferase [Planctomycetota bacterium]